DVEVRHEIGLHTIMWGGDYPHHEGTWPHTKLSMRANFWGIPEDEVRAMTSGNAAEMYGFDLAFLDGLAERIGPTVEELAVQPLAEEVPANPFSGTLLEVRGVGAPFEL